MHDINTQNNTHLSIINTATARTLQVFKKGAKIVTVGEKWWLPLSRKKVVTVNWHKKQTPCPIN
jgi:hypothetical protein